MELTGTKSEERWIWEIVGMRHLFIYNRYPFIGAGPEQLPQLQLQSGKFYWLGRVLW
jgi:hypothetical protein